MGNAKQNLKRLKNELSVNYANLSVGNFSSLDKGDRAALTVGGVIAYANPKSTTGGNNGSEIGTALDTFWAKVLLVAWGLVAVLGPIALIWTKAAGSREASGPLSWLRRIFLVIVGTTFFVTVIKLATVIFFL